MQSKDGHSLTLHISAYGAAEITGNYQRFLRFGFLCSVVFHLALLGLYWVLVGTQLNDQPERTIRIRVYEERFAPQSSQVGLSYTPILQQSSPLLSSPAQQVPAPAGFSKTPPTKPQPTRGLGIGDIPNVMHADKIDVSNLSPEELKQTQSRSDAVGGRGGDRENRIPGGSVRGGGTTDSPAGSAGSGIGSNSKPMPGVDGVGAGGIADGYWGGQGKELGLSIHWLGGGTRKKISGALPSYPEGAKVEAEVKLHVVVTPIGNVTSLYPKTKSDARFEEAALRVVRLWRFEPLQSSFPQVEQECEVTFHFRVK